MTILTTVNGYFVEKKRESVKACVFFRDFIAFSKIFSNAICRESVNGLPH